MTIAIGQLFFFASASAAAIAFFAASRSIGGPYGVVGGGAGDGGCWAPAGIAAPINNVVAIMIVCSLRIVSSLLLGRFEHSLIERNRKFVDSLLEGDGFELPVPRAMQARLEAKIAGFGCVRRRLSAAAVGGHQLMRKAKSRNRTLIARGTGSSNPSPSSGESSANLIFGAASRRRGCRAPSIILSAPASSPAIRALR